MRRAAAMTNEGTAAAATPSDSSSSIASELTPFFKLIFLTVFALTLLSLVVYVAVVIMVDNPNDQAKGLIDTCSTTWKMGFGAIVGLIGGKAT
jgi:hypothetical protein